MTDQNEEGCMQTPGGWQCGKQAKQCLIGVKTITIPPYLLLRPALIDLTAAPKVKNPCFVYISTTTAFVPWDILWAMLIWVKTRGVLPLCLSFGCFFELGMLSYLIWKKTSRATCWYENQDHSLNDRYFMTMFGFPPGVYQPPSTFWSVTLQPRGADQATIKQKKGKIHSLHMRVISLLFTKNLQRYRGV